MSALQVPINTTDHCQGDLHAPLMLLEYGDFQCPACEQIRLLIKRLQHYYGVRLCYVFRHFPQKDTHDEAFNAALVAEFAARKGQFWPVYELLYDYQDQLGWTLYSSIASKFAWSIQELDSALQRGYDEASVNQDYHSGVVSGVLDTPSLFLNGQMYQGKPDFLVIEYLCDSLLQHP